MVLTDFHAPAMEFLKQDLRQAVVGADPPMKINGVASTAPNCSSYQEYG